MPALQRAMRIQERAAKVGFEWRRKTDVWKKVKEETRELETALATKNKKRREEEFGDFLFALVNYARYVDVNPENALRSTIEKFIRRFRYIEKELKKSGKNIHDSSLAEMDKHWDNAKQIGV